MATKNGNNYISQTITDSSKIATANPEFSTMAN